MSFSRAFRKAGQRSRERSLAGTKYGFLRHLRETDARLGELAHQLVVSAPVASRAVEALEAENLVERRTDPADARAVLISITERVPGITAVTVDVSVMTRAQRDALTEKLRKGKPKTMQFGPDSLTQIVAVTSGKGGVGKSTLTANLAVSLAQSG